MGDMYAHVTKEQTKPVNRELVCLYLRRDGNGERTYQSNAIASSDRITVEECATS
jgi:hypothetical protein